MAYATSAVIFAVFALFSLFLWIQSPTPATLELIKIMGPFAVGAIGLVIAKQVMKTDEKVDKLTVNVDGRLSQLLASKSAESLSTGTAVGVEQERVRTELREQPPVVTEAESSHPLVVGEPVEVSLPGVEPVEVIVQSRGTT